MTMSFFNYLFGSEIRNIIQGAEAITTYYDGSLITSETLVKTGAAPSFQFISIVMSMQNNVIKNNIFLKKCGPAQVFLRRLGVFKDLESCDR